MSTTVGSKRKQRLAVMDGSIDFSKTQPEPNEYANALVQAKAFQRQGQPVPSRIQKIIDAHDAKVTAAKAAASASEAARREAKALSRKAQILKHNNEGWFEGWLNGTFGEAVNLLSPGAVVAIDAERFNRDLAAAASASAAATRASARN